MNIQFVLLGLYILGQALVAVVAPLISYFLTRPHLERVAAKVEEVAVQTNGQSIRLEQLARQQGFDAGVAEGKAKSDA